jgi:hypothetical protein
LAQITCSNCGEVFEEQEFCPHCGQWVGPLPESGYEEFALDQPEEEAPPPPPSRLEMITCPSCGAANPATNRHCEQCGARISQGPLPVAPQPVIRTTAGARALAIILGTIAVVVVVAILFNSIFSKGSAVADSTTTSTSTTVLANPVQIIPVDWTCSSALKPNGNFSCDSLFDGDDATYWNDASAKGLDAKITVTFSQPYALQSIVFKNVSDDTKFEMNYKVKGYRIELDDLEDAPVIGQLENTNRPQSIPVGSYATTQLIFRVTSTYPSVSVDGETPYNELAIAEIEFYGRPTG